MPIVFMGAPSASELKLESSYSWKRYEQSLSSDRSVDPASFDVASRRISRLYQNAIFQEEEMDDSQLMTVDDGTLLSWPPSLPSKSQERSKGYISFLNTTSRVESQQTEDSFTQSIAYSDSSSIAHFPLFHFNSNAITSLASLQGQKGSRKLSMLLAVFEVEGPDLITLKKGSDAGKEIQVLKMILGDEDHVCKLTAWRQIAEVWGGLKEDIGIRRGDIVRFENVTATYEPGTATSLAASPYSHSRAEICYRTMASTPADAKFRPDLRLGITDASVRQVADLVKWFENMAGLKRH